MAKKDEDFDEVVVPNGSFLRVPKTKECEIEECEAASRSWCYGPPVGMLGCPGPMPHPTPYPMPYPTTYLMPYPTTYPMTYSTPSSTPYTAWPMKFKCKKKEEKVWKEFKSDNGRAYYYNTVTMKSQWEKPKDLDEKKKKKTPEEERPRPPKQETRKYSNVSIDILGLRR